MILVTKEVIIIVVEVGVAGIRRTLAVVRLVV